MEFQAFSEKLRMCSRGFLGIVGAFQKISGDLCGSRGLRKLSEAFHGCSSGLRGLQRRSKRFQGNSRASPQLNGNTIGTLQKFPENP